MDYFNEEAILSYILLIDISNDNNLLEPSDYINRIKFLINSIDPKSELLNTIKTKYRSILNNNHLIDCDKIEKTENDQNNIDKIEILENSSSNNSIIQFQTLQNGVLGNKWIFHKNDDDFFPSVPHGHLGSSKSNIKFIMDPFVKTKNSLFLI